MHKLVDAGARGDRDALHRTMDLLVAEAASEGRHSEARRLSTAARSAKTSSVAPLSSARSLPDSVRDLLVKRAPRRRLTDLILPETIVEDVQEFVAEQAEVSLLRSQSLEPRHAVLLVGPPGNGKTSLAEAIATEMGLPFLTVRYDGVVDSFLGETASRIRRVIEYAAASPCVLFFDEFDAIGKERGDIHETGEIKRVVNSLLVQLDELPSHCVIVCATNHPELLDRAVWRRFELKIELPPPGGNAIARLFQRLVKAIGDTGLSEAQYVEAMQGRNISEIEQFNLDVKRRLVLSKGSLNSSQAVRSVLNRWSRQFSLAQMPSRPNEENGKTPDRKNSTPARRRKPKAGKKSSLSSQDSLPGTV
ncbi:AAA family ATPase [Methylobacterium haplocladii]|uniref:ATPase n=1 Tax=Methylobacterium haplocladii TaxID=1176176 RepID=A0A512IUX5_9HYPH|nr:AAA family ATPase [Methylobacterium haplocladii]GEP01501.1 ATPase [Methylobacterium haplocladii]